MKSKVIEQKIYECAVVHYRRVSTEQQAKDGYSHQLNIVRLIYPEFTIAKSTIHHIKEVMSGRADVERRMASGLGNALKMLKRHPNSILLVSDTDRIARRPDIFDLIQAQQLGHRVYVASTGLCVNEIIEAGTHRKIETQTKIQHRRRIDGQKKYRASGGVLGSPDIGRQSKEAAAKAKQLAKDRQSEILSIISKMVIGSTGHRPTYGEICDEINERGLRTGHGRFHTPERLSQLRKRNPGAWKYAFESYRRPRLRIRFLITAALVEHRRRRIRKWRLKTLLLVINGSLYCPKVPSKVLRSLNDVAPRLTTRHHKNIGRDGCRGPPLNGGHLVLHVRLHP